jgi:glycerophosphoryl diester phosphodiesterase
LSDNHPEFMCVAHRGAMGHEPENTLLAVKKALDLKAKWIEIDVHYVDRHLIVVHDETLCHSRHGTIHINEQTFDYLRTLDMGKGQKIPTLEEVLDLIDQRANINIELKGDKTAAPVCEVVKRYIDSKQWKNEHFLLSSFKYQELEHARRLMPEINIGLLIDDLNASFFDVADRIGATFLNIGLNIVNPDIIRDAHGKGIKVLVFTVNSAENIRRVREMGADGVFTDFPERCMALDPHYSGF